MTGPNYNNFEGMNLYDNNGEKIGKFQDLYLDDESDQPKWATISSGIFGLKQHYVPLTDVTKHEDGYKTPYAKEAILSAPSIDADEYLAADEEDRLYTHYSINGARDLVGASQTDDTGMTQSDQASQEDRQQHEPGRMRLRKYVVLEEVEDTEPSANADQATAGSKKTSTNRAQRQQPAFGEVQNETASDQRAGSYKADIDDKDL